VRPLARLRRALDTLVEFATLGEYPQGGVRRSGGVAVEASNVKGEVMHDPIEGPKVSVSSLPGGTTYAYEVWVGDRHAFARSAEEALELARELLASAGPPEDDPEGEMVGSLADLCRRLLDAHVARAVGEYHGTDDEGWVQEVVLYDADGKKVGQAGSEQFGEAGGVLEEAVRDYVGAAIHEAGYSGYENNDGGGGKVTIDATIAEAVVEHYEYVTEQEESPTVVLKPGRVSG
jgi:hypothetical protein